VTGGIEIRGPRLLLRALQAGEIDEEWQAMVDADPMTIAALPDEEAFRARLRRSGRLVDGELDLAIDLDGALIGRIQTFVPPGRPLPSGTFEVGIGLREHAQGQDHGREALALLTGAWPLFEARPAAQVCRAPGDPANAGCGPCLPPRAAKLGPGPGSQTEFGRPEWAVYPGSPGRTGPRDLAPVRGRIPC
jgi:hypothetical protein